MTDKVQKIREEVARLKSNLIHGACSSQTAMETRCKEEAYNEVFAILDSTQEEPKECMYSKDNYTDEDRKVLCDGCEEGCKYNKKGTVNDKLGGINTALVQDKLIWQNNIKHDCSFCSMPDCVSSNSSAKDNCLLGRKKEPSIPDIVDEHFYEMLGEEPVSEDLEEAADNALNNVLNTHEIVNIRSCLEMFRFGANWKQQQMMAKTIDTTAKPDYNEIWCNLSSSNLKDGDKVKVIVIKKD